MFKQVIIPFLMTDLVLVGELLFFAIFVASLFWVFRKGSNEYYARLASLPIEGSTGLPQEDLGGRQ